MTDAPELDRRRFLGCAALFGVAGPMLVACSSGGSGSSSGGGTSSSGGGSSSGGSGGGKSGGTVLVATKDVPVGGGVILTDVAVAVTQPKQGTFLAFDAHCTHQGTIIGAPQGGLMTCPLHGSQFDLQGNDVRGPNGSPAGSTADLVPVSVTVKGGNVVRT